MRRASGHAVDEPMLAAAAAREIRLIERCGWLDEVVLAISARP